VARSFLIKQPLSRFITEDCQDQFYLYRQQLLKTKVHELKLVRKDGEQFHARLECVTVLDDEGNLSQIRLAVTDITERKQIEEALQKAHDELEQRVIERTAELSKANETLRKEIVERKQAELERSRLSLEKAHLFEKVNQQREQLRALTGRLAESQETERKQLALELHDRVGRNLTALGLNLHIIQAKVANHLPEDGLVLARLDDSLALVEQTAECIRDVMANLRPPVLDDYGLVVALEWYVDQLTKLTGLIITVQGEKIVPRLAPPVENVLFRIAQEALTNVTKHAQAVEVTIKLVVDDETVKLIVIDDGIGFKLTTRGERQGWGLITMTERALSINGHCQIVSAPGKGTQVTVKVKR
jgi:signal transduction histidine kinase